MKREEKDKADLLKTYLTQEMVTHLNRHRSMSAEEALRFFLKTETYKHLKNDNTYLYLERKECVWGMLQREMKEKNLNNKTGSYG